MPFLFPFPSNVTVYKCNCCHRCRKISQYLIHLYNSLLIVCPIIRLTWQSVPASRSTGPAGHILPPNVITSEFVCHCLCTMLIFPTNFLDLWFLPNISYSIPYWMLLHNKYICCPMFVGNNWPTGQLYLLNHILQPETSLTITNVTSRTSKVIMWCHIHTFHICRNRVIYNFGLRFRAEHSLNVVDVF